MKGVCQGYKHRKPMNSNVNRIRILRSLPGSGGELTIIKIKQTQPNKQFEGHDMTLDSAIPG